MQKREREGESCEEHKKGCDRKKKRLGEEYKYFKDKKTRETNSRSAKERKCSTDRRRGGEEAENRGSLDEARHPLPGPLRHLTYAVSFFLSTQTGRRTSINSIKKKEKKEKKKLFAQQRHHRDLVQPTGFQISSIARKPSQANKHHETIY